LTIECAEDYATDPEIVDAQMEGYEEEEGGICRQGCDEARDDKGAELENHTKSAYYIGFGCSASDGQLTSMPRRERIVSLLESLALRSPTSPVPSMGVAKCSVMAALEPPAAMPQRALKEALRQRAPTRRPGIAREVRRGEKVLRIMEVSLRASAKRRYALASGTREEPKAYAP
jgi:hypothetical protein